MGAQNEQAVYDKSMCTRHDEQTIQKAGVQHSPTSFPAITRQCGVEAYSVIRGFQKSNYVKCLSGRLDLSESCSMCYADEGNWGSKVCIWPCLISWCNAKCLA